MRCAWYRAWRCFKVLSMAESEPGGEIARSELRASHDDRDRVVEMLRVSAGDGRLTAEELDDRLEQAMTARTYGELARLVADLPTAGPVASPAVAPQVKDVVRIDTRSGHVKRVDRWVVPQRMEVKVTSGHVTLDFTRAVITHPTLALDVDVRSGAVKLMTRPGIVVDADDVTIRSGGVTVKAPWGSDGPVDLHIAVTGTVGSGHLVARPRNRNFWQWLTRQPKPYMIATR